MSSLSQVLELVGPLSDSPGEHTACERFRSHLEKYVSDVGQLRDQIDESLRTSGDQYNRALQDLVNHLGRFLGFEVTFGRYRGIQDKVGFDGLWKSPTGFHLVVEVKTTEAYALTAPVELPSQEQMKVKLVPLQLVNRLEETRSDLLFWSEMFWAVIGAILGIVGSLCTSYPAKITVPSVAIMVTLIIIGALTLIGGVCKLRDRTQGIKLEMTKSGVNLPDRAFATLQRQSADKVLTISSGSVGQFSHKRTGPWGPPVACNPVHDRWRAIEEATWVWISKRPTDEEAQAGQVAWHRFEFVLERPTTSLAKATLSLTVDDRARVIVNGKLVRTVTIEEEVVELDVISYLRWRSNLVEMEIENAASPQSTGLSNPAGVVYRLQIR